MTLGLQCPDESTAVAMVTAAGRIVWSVEFTGIIAGSLVVGSDRARFRAAVSDVELPGHGPCIVGVTLSLDDAVELQISGAGDFPFDELEWPRPVQLEVDRGDRSRWSVLRPELEGMLYPVTDVKEPTRVPFYASGYSLPMVALCSEPHQGGPSLLVISPEGYDHGIQVHTETLGQGVGLGLVHVASMGRWEYERVWRIAWLPSGGLVALAARVRDELERSGLTIPSLPEKLKESGIPEDLWGSIGGTHLWWQETGMPATLPQELRAANLDGVLLQGQLSTAEGTAEVARRCGYVTAPYVQTFDLFPPGVTREREWRDESPAVGASDGWTDELARERDGMLHLAWNHLPTAFVDGEPLARYWDTESFLTEGGEVGERDVALHHEVMTQTYHRCSQMHEQFFRKWEVPRLHRDGYTGVFIDILTALELFECYSESHPSSRREDMEARRAALKVGGEEGRYVGSESGTWWALDRAHGFEGLLTRWESDRNFRMLVDYPLSERWLGDEFNLEKRVPFFAMVAGHSVSRTPWWGAGQDRHAETWRAKDAICGLFGGNPTFIVDRLHPLDPGTPRWNGFLNTVKAFDELRKQTMGRQIVRYEVYSATDGLTEFEDGTVVEADIAPLAPGQAHDAAEPPFRLSSAGS
jgi:hypothetical protein